LQTSIVLILVFMHILTYSLATISFPFHFISPLFKSQVLQLPYHVPFDSRFYHLWAWSPPL